MRRVLTTLMILLVVLVAGLSALVLLVNPNDFRAYMVRQVEARSGYQLKLDGPLRWHVWPQLSILSGRMSLTAPGASQPLVAAAAGAGATGARLKRMSGLAGSKSPGVRLNIAPPLSGADLSFLEYARFTLTPGTTR